MVKIIKTADGRQSGVARYEHHALESINPEQYGGKDYVDPAAILAEARALAEQKVEEAYAEGLARGTEAGEARFKESVAEAGQMLHAASEALTQAREQFLASTEQEVVRLAVAIARKLVEREISMDPSLVADTARRAIEKILDAERVVVRVHPGDLEAMREHRVTLLEEFEAIKALEVVADDSVEPGGCVAETDQIEIDARIEAQIEEILKTLKV